MFSKKWCFPIVGMVLGFLLVAGCGPSSQPSSSEADSQADSGTQETQEEMTIRIAYNLPEEHPVGLYFETFADEIEKNTASTSIKLEAQTFPNGQLYNDTDIPDALTTGGLEIGGVNPGFLASEESESLRITQLPFLFNSWEAEWAAEDGEYSELYNQELEKFGMTLLGWAAYGTVEIYGNKPIRVPDDIVHMKMRALGQDAAMWLEDMGASPITMSSQELYQALERGVVDGYTTGPSSVVDRSLYEVTDYGTQMVAMYVSFPSIANVNWWNSLPEDVQEAILEASQTAQQIAREKAKEEDDEYKEKLTEHGVEQYKPSPEELELWIEASSKRYDSYLERSGEVGQQFLDIVEKVNNQHPVQ